VANTNSAYRKNDPTNQGNWQKNPHHRTTGRNKRGKQTRRSGEIPTIRRMPSVRSPWNKTRYQRSCKSVRETSNQTKHTKLQDSIKGLGVFVLDKVHRTALAEARQFRTRDSCGRFVSRRTSERNNRYNSTVWKSDDPLVHPKAKVVSLSNSESEYIAAAEGAKNASWLRQPLGEMKIGLATEPVILLTDNDASQKLSQGTTYQQRTRHIDNRYHLYTRPSCEGNS
jgi:hypothetical protein